MSENITSDALMTNGESSAEQEDFRPTAADISGSARKQDRKFREFTSHPRPSSDSRAFDCDVHSGNGMTVETVIASLVECFEKSIASEVPESYPTADDQLAVFGDEVIWQGNRLAAVVLPRPGGIKVVRLDNEIPENPEVGPTNCESRSTPRPERQIHPLTPNQKDLLESARKIGYEEASIVLTLANALNKPIVPGSREQRTSEAVGRMMLLPEDRFLWRRAAGFTTTDDEARAEMDRVRAENPGYRVAEVLTDLEQEMLEKLRKIGLKESDAILSAIVALDLDLDEALARLAGDGERKPALNRSPGLTIPPPKLPEWSADPVALSIAVATTRGAFENHIDASHITKYEDTFGSENHNLDIIGFHAADRFNASCITTIRAVLAWHGRDKEHPERYPSPNCAVKMGGNLFIAVHSSEEDLRDDAEEAAKANTPQMSLAVLPLARIIDLDSIEAPPIPDPSKAVPTELQEAQASDPDEWTREDLDRVRDRNRQDVREPFIVLNAGGQMYYSSRRTDDLARVVNEEVEDLTPGRDDDEDRVVFHQGKCLAVLKAIVGEAPNVIMLDGLTVDVEAAGDRQV